MKNNSIQILLFICFIGWIATALYYENRSVNDISDELVIETAKTADTSYQKRKDSLVYVPIPVPVPYKVTDTFEVPAIVDTGAIIRNYFSKYFISDTLANDSNLLVVVEDTLFSNKIISRKKIIERNFPTIKWTITNTQVKYYDGLFLGGLINGSDAAITLDWQKNKHQFGAGYSLNQKWMISYKYLIYKR